MKQTFTLLLVAFALIGTQRNAQQLKRLKEGDIALSIIQAEIDGEDYTEKYLENGAFLAFYTEDGQECFTNAWCKPDTQSYGTVVLLEYNNDTEEGIETASYLWKYANTYDDHRGTAIILVSYIHRAVSVAFELCIMTEEAEILIFKGYVNDRLNWKPYF